MHLQPPRTPHAAASEGSLQPDQMAGSEEHLGEFCTSHLPWRIDVHRPISVVTSRVGLGGPWFVDCSVGRMVGRRGGREIDSTPADYMALLMVKDGTELFTQDDSCAEVTPGSATLWDSTRPAECFSASTLRKHTLFIPRGAVAPAFLRVAAGGPHTIPASPNLQLLFSWLEVAHRHSADPRAASRAGVLAMDLVHAAVADARGEAGESRDVLLLRVKSHLGQQLHDSTLTLEDTARACSISLRYLHVLFEGTGETPAEHLRRRRLERARKLLTASRDSLSITQVSQACGFTSPSSFSRAFRSEYGISPRDCRDAVSS